MLLFVAYGSVASWLTFTYTFRLYDSIAYLLLIILMILFLLIQGYRTYEFIACIYTLTYIFKISFL